MTRKRPLTVAEAGARGGRADSEAQRAHRANARQWGGRKARYRLVGERLERRDGDLWAELTPPYDEAAKAFLRRHRR